MVESPRPTAGSIAVVLGVVVLGLALRLAFFSGYVAGDDRGYIARAQVYASGEARAPYSHWGARSGVVVPTALAYAVFGVDRVSTVFVPFALSLLTIALAAALARHLFDARTGVLAAFLVAIFPMEVLFASQLFPSAFLSFLTTASLYVFVRAADGPSLRLAALAGGCLGLAYLCRITALYCLLFFALYAVWERRIDAKYWAFAAGLGAVVALEMAAFAWLAGDPLLRFDILIAKKVGAAGGREVARGLQWMLEPFVRPFVEQEFGAFFYLLLPVAVLAAIRPRARGATILLLWVIPIFLYVSYGTISPFEYKTMRRLPRYLSPVMVPWLVLLAWYLVALARSRLRVVILAGLAVTSLAALWLDNSRFVTVPTRELTTRLSGYASEPVVVQRSVLFDVLFYSGFRGEERLILFTHAEDSSDTLDRILSVAPGIARVDRESEICSGLLVHDVRYFPDTVSPLLGAELLFEVGPQERAHHRLLQSQYALSLLRLVRDPKRIRKLSDRRDQTIRVYRLATPCESTQASG